MRTTLSVLDRYKLDKHDLVLERAGSARQLTLRYITIVLKILLEIAIL